MNVLDLFSGIGGFSLGLERAGMKTIAFCEIDPFCQKVLKKHWPDIKIYKDIKGLTNEELQANGIKGIDLICGGFPCQPFSIAGKKQGKKDDRDLWPEMFRLISEVRPTWIIGENVANFINMEFERTAIDLESAGYEVQAFVIPACAINAPHQRKRIWIIANSKCKRWNWRNGKLRMGNESNKKKNAIKITGSGCESFANSISQGLERLQCSIGKKSKFSTYNYNDWIEAAARICGINDGIPDRMDRIKSLGNAIVPQIAEILGTYIMEVENNNEDN